MASPLYRVLLEAVMRIQYSVECHYSPACAFVSWFVLFPNVAVADILDFENDVFQYLRM